MSTLALRNTRAFGSKPASEKSPIPSRYLENMSPTASSIQQDLVSQKTPSPGPSVDDDKASRPESEKRISRKVSDPRMSVEMIAFGDRDERQTGATHTSPSPSPSSANPSTQTSSPPMPTDKSQPPVSPKSHSPQPTKPPFLRETLSARRKHVPKPLDVNALRRERQYSGPYSAAPLLAQNETYRPQNNNDTHPCYLSASDTDTVESDPKKIRLPQITPAPYVSSKLSHLQLPPCGHPSRTRPSIPQVPVSPASTLLSPQPPKSMISGGESHSNCFNEKGGSNRNSRPRDISAWTPVSAHFDPKQRNKRLLSQAFEESSINQSTNDKKARFMVLCEEIWELFQE